MGTPYLGEIMMVSFNYAPPGWASANGQLLQINQSQALFSLFGTKFGGDGRTNFAIPDLRSRVPIHRGSHNIGEAGGQEAHVLDQTEMPQHRHILRAAEKNATTDTPSNTVVLAGTAPNDLYTGFNGGVPMYPATISSVGGSQPHENRQPFLVINYVVALIGEFPSQN
jgi:microcystin-dependent protein